MMPQRPRAAPPSGAVVPECVPGSRSVVIERHRPTRFAIPYHQHASVEMNFLSGCSMTYDFDQQRVEAADQHLTLFWGAVPHSVAAVAGDGDRDGEIMNVYVALSEFLSWNLPDLFVRDVIAGRAVCNPAIDLTDALVFARWAGELRTGDTAVHRLVYDEVEARVRRLAVTGWRALNKGLGDAQEADEVTGQMQKVEAMLQYVADNFADSLSVPEVAEHVHLSDSHAARLFRKTTGVSIKEHIIRTRLASARVMLANSEEKILNVALDSGFQSVSAFYKAFEERAGQTPAAFRRKMRGL